MARRDRECGSAMLEFVLTGIMLIWVWIGIFYLSLGMWQFHTLQHATKEAVLYLSTHGAYYVEATGSSIKIENVANVLAGNAVGVPPSGITATFTASSSSYSCRLDACQTDTTVWPPTSANSVGTDITIKASYTLQTAFGMWTPDHGVSNNFSNSYALSGYSHQQIVF